MTEPTTSGQGQPEPKASVPTIQGPRLPYHPAIEEKFGIDKSGWRALVEAIFPGAKSPDSVILALSYCKARGLDPFRRVVHIVPIWDKARQCYVETVWPGIAELRSTAFRTGEYAGREETRFGDAVSRDWQDGRDTLTLEFPAWAQVTVFRYVRGCREAFAGPRVHWLETFASTKSGAPNAMWRKRPYGQLDKCAEAAALRVAFPEEVGGELTVEEISSHGWHGRLAVAGETMPSRPAPSSLDELADRMEGGAESDAEATVEESNGQTREMYLADLAGCTGIREVDAVLKEYLGRFIPTLGGWAKKKADDRKAEIRASRGASKPADGELFPKEPAEAEASM
jgi:phage recombination protein Bet